MAGGFEGVLDGYRKRVIMRIAKVPILFAALVLFVVGGCIGGDSAEENTSTADGEHQEADVDVSNSATSSSSDEDSEYDSGPTDTNYSNYDADIPESFPDVIPIYDIENSTVMGSYEQQDTGGTMMYGLVLGSNDRVSDVSDAIISSLENIDLNMPAEESALLIGYMGDWDYTITVDNGEVDGFTTIITYSLVEKQ